MPDELDSAPSLPSAEGLEGTGDQILSQSEINALLEAVSEGRIESSPAGSAAFSDGGVAPEVLDYDLTSQDRVIRGRMPTLDIIDDRFCRLSRVSLAGLLRKVVQVSVESTNLMKFGEFLNYLPIPSCLNIVRLSPLRGSSLIAIQAKLVFQLIDTLFGGSEQYGGIKDEGRDFTSIEQMVVRRVVNLLLFDLAESWKPIVRLAPEFVRTEVNPQFVAVVSHQEVVIQTTYEVEIEGVRGTLHVIIPFSSVEPFKGRLASGVLGEHREIDPTWVTRLIDQIKHTQVALRSRLGRTSVSVRELLRLQVGDVLQLDQRADQPVDVEVERCLKFRGKPVVSSGYMGVKIAEKLPQALGLPGNDSSGAGGWGGGVPQLTAGSRGE